MGNNCTHGFGMEFKKTLFTYLLENKSPADACNALFVRHYNDGNEKTLLRIHRNINKLRFNRISILNSNYIQTIQNYISCSVNYVIFMYLDLNRTTIDRSGNVQ